MAYLTWPSNLNYILDRSSFAIDPNDQIARSDFDDGPPMVRMRYTNPTYLYQGAITMTNEEFMVFHSFYRNVIAQGTKWFLMSVWIGTSYVVHKCRFKEKFTVSDAGWNQYTVNINLEVRDYFTYSTAAIYFVDRYGTEASLYLGDHLDISLNLKYYPIFHQGNWPPHLS